MSSDPQRKVRSLRVNDIIWSFTLLLAGMWLRDLNIGIKDFQSKRAREIVISYLRHQTF